MFSEYQNKQKIRTTVKLTMKTSNLMSGLLVASAIATMSTTVSASGASGCCTVSVEPTREASRELRGSNLCSNFSSSSNFNTLSSFRVCTSWSTVRMFNKMTTQFINKDRCFSYNLAALVGMGTQLHSRSDDDGTTNAEKAHGTSKSTTVGERFPGICDGDDSSRLKTIKLELTCANPSSSSTDSSNKVAKLRKAKLAKGGKLSDTKTTSLVQRSKRGVCCSSAIFTRTSQLTEERVNKCLDSRAEDWADARDK